MERKWLDNAFWNNEEKTQLKAILEITDAEGRRTTQVVTVNNNNPDGTQNPDWIGILNQVGADKVDTNTKDRLERLAKEEQAKELRKKDQENAKKLEALFEAKLQAFEIEEIKNSTNRALKTKLRRAKSIIEVNLYAMMIVMETLENEQGEVN